jgi:pimeloyl-ACP methyl ester carboxylesterase
MATALRLWSRPYTVPAEPFQTRSSDGVILRGHRLGRGDVALVFCHGFLGWHRKARLVAFQEELARSFTVYAFDFRGHGESGGESTFGGREILDIEAVVRLIRGEGFDRVITFGGSMGGIAVIRHAALLGGVEGVLSVSTPATWSGHESEAIRRAVWLTSTPSGRWVLRSSGVRVARAWERFEAPVDVVDRISPTPLWLVHGRDDHFFDEEQAWLLYRRAGEPKRLLLASRFGHAEDGFSTAFAGHVSEIVLRGLATTPASRTPASAGSRPAAAPAPEPT